MQTHTSSALPSSLRLSVSASLLLASAALAQTPIFSNQSTDPYSTPLSTGATTISGAPAPANHTWSELQSDATGANAVGGLAAHASTSGAFRLADNFTITNHPARIDRITLYAYQPGATTNPFASVNLRIWNAQPGTPGATVVFGDTTTNRLLSVTSANIYRAFNTSAAPFPMTPDTSKLIWELSVAAGPTTLQPGEYWLDWQIVPLSPALEAFTPAVTKPAERTQPGANARQFTTTGWTSALDTGKPASAADAGVELPFVLHGYAGQPPCNSDFNGDGDFGTDADIEAFFACLAGTCCPVCGPADFNGDGDSGTDADIESFFRVLAGNEC